MKRYLSVLMIAVKSTLYKLIGIMLCMAVLEAALFYRLLQKQAQGALYLLEELVQKSGLPLVCGMAFLLFSAVLCLFGCEFSGSKLSFTLKRLTVSEQAAALLWSLYYFACFVIFWAAQLGIALLLCRLYTNLTDPAYLHAQSVFVAFHRSGFLYSLLPLSEISRILRNISLAAGLGVSASYFSFRQRRGQKGLAAPVLSVMTVLAFPQEMGSFGSDMFMMFMALTIGAYSVYGILRRQADED